MIQPNSSSASPPFNAGPSDSNQKATTFHLNYLPFDDHHYHYLPTTIGTHKQRSFRRRHNHRRRPNYHNGPTTSTNSCAPGEMGFLLFGIYLVYKLRNASSEAHKEKLVLCASVFIELLVSGLTYTIRHLLWTQLTSDQLLLLYFVRCQLTVTPTVALIFAPKVSLTRYH